MKDNNSKNNTEAIVDDLLEKYINLTKRDDTDK